MIQQMENLPDNVVGFKALGEVTKDDYENVLMPAVRQVVDKHGELNYVFEVDTDLKNFTPGAWMMDAWLGVKNLFKWHRGAIVSDSKEIRGFTDKFSFMIPGEFKGFSIAERQAAIDWVSGKTTK